MFEIISRINLEKHFTNFIRIEMKKQIFLIGQMARKEEKNA